MAHMPLGQRLVDAGWKQGVLLPPVSSSVVFLPSHALTGIAKRAKDSPPADTTNVADSPSHSVASGILRKTDAFVVISQTCDIKRAENDEPTVLAMRVYTTDNDRTLSAAASNSARTFLLDPDRRLVVDATMLSVIEKPVLETVIPRPGAPNASVERRFARWVAARFSRYAFPDPIVAAVTRPILDGLHKLQQAGGPDLTALDPLEEIHVAPTAGDPPYDVSLLFIVPETGLPDGGAGLARIVGHIDGWLTPGLARLASWDAVHYGELSVRDYFDHEKLQLDEYTYQGVTVRGLEPYVHRIP